jgi:hypothetical protein
MVWLRAEIFAQPVNLERPALLMRLLAKLGKFRANLKLPGLSLRLDEPLLQLSNIDGQR